MDEGTTAYLSLGSNLGDRVAFLAEAVARLESEQVHLRRVSSVYETVPQGKTDQPMFLNLVAEVETACAPLALLQHTQAIEQAGGRVRHERWGARTLDVDILLYGQATVHEPNLDIPHPRMLERAFVLIPLVELSPDAMIETPNGRCNAAQALVTLPDQGVRLFLPAASFLKSVRAVQ